MALARVRIDNMVDTAFVWECLAIKTEAYQIMAGLAYNHKPLTGIFQWGVSFAEEFARDEEANHGRTDPGYGRTA